MVYFVNILLVAILAISVVAGAPFNGKLHDLVGGYLNQTSPFEGVFTPETTNVFSGGMVKREDAEHPQRWDDWSAYEKAALIEHINKKYEADMSALNVSYKVSYVKWDELFGLEGMKGWLYNTRAPSFFATITGENFYGLLNAARCRLAQDGHIEVPFDCTYYLQ